MHYTRWPCIFFSFFVYPSLNSTQKKTKRILNKSTKNKNEITGTSIKWFNQRLSPRSPDTSHSTIFFFFSPPRNSFSYLQMHKYVPKISLSSFSAGNVCKKKSYQKINKIKIKAKWVRCSWVCETHKTMPHICHDYSASNSLNREKEPVD